MTVKGSLAASVLKTMKVRRDERPDGGMKLRIGKTFYCGRVTIDVDFDTSNPPEWVAAYRYITARCYNLRTESTLAPEWHCLSAFRDWWEARVADAPVDYVMSWAFGSRMISIPHYAPDQGCWIPRSLAHWPTLMPALQGAAKRRVKLNLPALLPGVSERQGRYYEARSRTGNHLTVVYPTQLEAHHAWMSSRVNELRDATASITLEPTRTMLLKRIEVLETMIANGEEIWAI